MAASAGAFAADSALGERERFDGECDVIVAGGGPAGIAAARAAAKAGAKVKLFEMHGSLGGIWTSGLLACLIDFDKCETDREITRRLRELGATMPRKRNFNARNYIYAPEYMKYVCEEMCDEAGVEIHLHTMVTGVRKDGRKIAAVETQSKSGKKVWKAKTFIDCTGDGDLGALAGCGFESGGMQEGAPGQPASLCAIVAVDNPAAIARFAVNSAESFDERDKTLVSGKTEFLAELKRVGITPTYSGPTLFRFHGNLYVMMANQEYAVAVDDEAAITKATMRARRELIEMGLALERKGGETWKGFTIVATAEQLGHRGGRRLKGRYTLTEEDLAKGTMFEDAVATSRFGIDIHSPTIAGDRKCAAGNPEKRKCKPFQIPLRACMAADVDNLYMAGRCISGDFIAHSSYRVTGSAVQMGENIGKIAGKQG